MSGRAAEPIRVLVVDDHRLVRAGLSEIIARAGDIVVVGEAADGEAALHQAKALRPDVVLMDLQMPGMDGLDATRRLTKTLPGVHVLVLSALDAAPIPARLIEAGAEDFLHKNAAPEEVITAIREIARGCRRSVTKRAEVQDVFARLSGRELEVVLCLAEGLGTMAIAKRLCLSPQSVSTYRQRIYAKLEVDNEIEVVKAAARHGIVALGSMRGV